MTQIKNEEICLFLHNCCGTFVLNGNVGYSRFTQEQLEYYSRRSDADFVRSHTSAGIYLECKTDAPEIGFVYRIYTAKGAWMDNSGIDIWENGVFSENIRLCITDSEWIPVRYRRSSKEPSVIRIWFPNGVIFLPREFELGNAQPVPEKQRRILFYGDSLTQSSYIATPSLSWFCYTADYLDAEYLNRGIGSMIFDPDSLPAASDYDPDLVFIEYGLNDMVLTPDNDAAEKNASAWIEKLGRLYPKAEKYCILPTFRCPGRNEGYLDRLCDFIPRIQNICDQNDICCIPGEELIPALPNLYVDDCVHFNEAGSAVVANRLICYLKKMNKPNAIKVSSSILSISEQEPI